MPLNEMKIKEIESVRKSILCERMERNAIPNLYKQGPFHLCHILFFPISRMLMQYLQLHCTLDSPRSVIRFDRTSANAFSCFPSRLAGWFVPFRLFAPPQKKTEKKRSQAKRDDRTPGETTK